MKNKVLAVVMAGTLVVTLGACTKSQKTIGGAALGAAGGALIGNAIGGGTGAIIGGVAGAGAGAVIGNNVN